MLSLEKVIVDNIVKLESYFVKSPIIFMIAFFSSYVLLTALSIPVALLLGLLSGFIFDTFTAVVIISFASSIGATAAMLVSRYLIKDYINLKFNKQVLIINSELDIHGAYYLFALRMSPVFPFFIINAAFGLTNIKAWVFYIISQLGMLPGTIIIILIGSELDKFIIDQGPFEFDLIVYLTLFGLIPLIFKKYGMK
tara:strand:- start:199 stop:786 length:588 start_codon:yes stop_codon:yes gene_type:complete